MEKRENPIFVFILCYIKSLQSISLLHAILLCLLYYSSFFLVRPKNRFTKLIIERALLLNFKYRNNTITTRRNIRVGSADISFCAHVHMHSPLRHLVKMDVAYIYQPHLQRAPVCCEPERECANTKFASPSRHSRFLDLGLIRAPMAITGS